MLTLLRLILPLALVELLLAAALGLLARGLGRRLPRRVLAAAALAPWLLLAPWLFGDRLLVPTASLPAQVPGADTTNPGDAYDAGLNDAVLQFLPWELEVRHALARGDAPLWSDLVDGGSDLWSNLQAQVLSPTALLARVVPIQHALLVALVLKLLVATTGAWLLARALGVRGAAAAAAAACFAYGGALIPWAVFPHSAVAAWLPWVVLGTLTLARRPAPQPLIATALTTAALLLSGHPEVALSGSLLAGLAAIALRARRIPWRRSLGAPLAAGLLGLALAAPVWLPFLDLTRGSQRAHEQAQRRPALHGATLGEPASWFAEESERYLRGPLHPAPYWPPVAPANLRPRSHWTYNACLYLGIVGLAGLALAWTRPLPRRFLPFFLTWLAALLAVTDFLPLEALLQALPGMRLVEDSRFLPAGALAGALVAAHGLEQLLTGRRRRRIGLAIGAASAVSLLAGPPGLALGAWTAVAGAAALAAGGRHHRRLAAGALGLALLVDLGAWAGELLPRGQGRHFYPPTAFMARVARATSAAGGPWRAVGFDQMTFPNLLPVYGVADPRPHNPLAPQAQVEVLDAAFGYAPSIRQYFGHLLHPEHPLLDFLNVRAVILHALHAAPPGMPRIDRGAAASQPIQLRRNREALPRWFLPTAVETVDRSGLRGWIAGLTDARRVAVFADEAAGVEVRERSWDPAAVVARSARPGRLLLEVGGTETRLLATSLPGPRGWQARGGGHRLATLTVNGAFLGVVVPAGVERVALRFVPPGLGAGGLLAGLALLTLGACALAARRRRGAGGTPSGRWTLRVTGGRRGP